MNNISNFPNFLAKSKLICTVLDYIQTKRKELLGDLLAYSKDTVRYQRRIRMLINLAEYEQQILLKIRDFETDDVNEILDLTNEGIIIQEINSITDIAA